MPRTRCRLSHHCRPAGRRVGPWRAQTGAKSFLAPRKCHQVATQQGKHRQNPSGYTLPLGGTHDMTAVAAVSAAADVEGADAILSLSALSVPHESQLSPVPVQQHAATKGASPFTPSNRNHHYYKPPPLSSPGGPTTTDVCQYCHKRDNEDTYLLCDACSKGYHTYCLRYKLHYRLH